MEVPAFGGKTGFNAHHSPMGAFFTFTCGHFGTRGGMAVQLGKPGLQDVYIGVKDGDRYAPTNMRCLPFYEGADKGAQAEMPEVAQQAAESFLGEQADAAKAPKPKLVAYGEKQIKRNYGWGIDRWTTADLGFEICTPFGPIPDPATATAAEMRKALLPGVIAELRVDNTKGKQTKTGFFALTFHEPGARLLDEGVGAKRVGFALRNHMGVMGRLFDTAGNDYSEPAEKPFVFMRFGPVEGLTNRDNPVHLLGVTPGIGFEVPPGKCYSLVLAMGCYLDGAVTTRLQGKYLYTRYFADLLDVLDETMTSGYELWQAANQRDQELLASGLSPDQQFLIAHSTRSYYGSTELLDVGGQPYWIVNEGEYVMINTLDLSVDHVFWELRHNPWVVRNLLDNFVRFYTYHDEVRDPKTGAVTDGGISFCHDQGIHNQFSPLRHSSYEMGKLRGCFSYMTQEQICNWTLLAACYVAATNDVEWLRQHQGTIASCYRSMLHRDAFHPHNRNGIMGLDSSRCEGGWEITTYDSLDESLGQARNNLYLAVKCWATYLGLELMFGKLDDALSADLAHKSAHLTAATVTDVLQPQGYIPAVFEPDNKGWHSRILPAVEGLVYPLYWSSCPAAGPQSALEPGGEFAAFLAALKKHTQTLLTDAENRNRFADGGLKLSSSSNNSWMSKIAIFQHVSREVFGLEAGDARQKAADAAHVKWQVEGASAYWAMSDQIISGVAKGSKYYPRCVTSVLWLK